MCLSCICLLAMNTLICVTFSLPPDVGGWLRLLLVAVLRLFCLRFWDMFFSVREDRKVIMVDPGEGALGTSATLPKQSIFFSPPFL